MKTIRHGIAILLLIILLAATSCHKDTNTADNAHRVHTSTSVSSTYPFPVLSTYTYDASGRVSTVMSATGGTIYRYTSSSVSLITVLMRGGVTTYTDTIICPLTTAGYISRRGDYLYTYDADGYETSLAHLGSDTLTRQITDGNFVQGRDISQGAERIYNITFLSDSDSRDYGYPLYGRTDRNLRSILADTQTGSSSTPETTTYTYTFDSSHRVTQMVVRHSYGAMETFTYTYY